MSVHIKYENFESLVLKNGLFALDMQCKNGEYTTKFRFEMW